MILKPSKKPELPNPKIEDYINKKTMDCLPKDLWVQIFVRLPVKSILRCLSVCKSWQLFIQHPSFINSHLQHQRRDLMLVRSITVDDDKTTWDNSVYCDDDSFTVYAKLEYPRHHPAARPFFRVVGTCNGIICITSDGISHYTYLWNPTIRKCVKLPWPIFTFDSYCSHELGFGFDEKTKDYKVIRIVQKDFWEYPLEVEIYSLNHGIWREASHLAKDLGVRISEESASGRNCQLYLSGSVHWVGEDRNKSCFVVIAFHLGDEVFRCFETPLDIKHEFCWMQKLRPIVFQGSLALIQYSKPECSIWVLKDYGDSTSWAKYMNVNLSNHVDSVIGSRRNGELLIEIQGGLYSYEPSEGKKLNYLDKIDFQLWRFVQGGHPEGTFSQHIYDYDPKHAPKGLGIRSETKGSFRYSFYSESYTESLELIGRMNTVEVAEWRVNSSSGARRGGRFGSGRGNGFLW